jgi:uncharacterized membrane protein YqjE
MPLPEGSGSQTGPGLFTSLRSFWSVLLAILYTRLDLATTELEDEAVRGIQLVATSLIGLLALFSAFFFAMFLIIALAWNTPYQFWVIGAIFGFYLVVGVGCIIGARNMFLNRPRFLSQTIAELRRDVEGLNRAVAEKKAEPQP